MNDEWEIQAGFELYKQFIRGGYGSCMEVTVKGRRSGKHRNRHASEDGAASETPSAKGSLRKAGSSKKLEVHIMKVISFQAENIKKLVAVEIKPEGNLVEITGKNGQGKTSILDAIWWALDGNKVIQSKPVREGSEAGFIRLDLGDYVVTKNSR